MLAADTWSEVRFRAAVDTAAAGPACSVELLALLDERHPAYSQRSAAAVARMRGHALLALSLGPKPLPDALPFVLEELQSGREPYLLAAAARALCRITTPHPALAPFVLAALTTLEQHDDAVDLSRYGGAGADENAAPAFDEVLRSLVWLGPAAAAQRPALHALVQQSGGLAPEQRQALERAIRALPAQLPLHWGDARVPWTTTRSEPAAAAHGLNDLVLEDQDAQRLTWAEFFVGAPSVVAFFYTRCNNAGKCSLTISKVARFQQRLREAECFDRVRIAAITYDPEFDAPKRLRGYAQSRGMRFAAGHRVLRVVDGQETLCQVLGLGVSFAASVVNHHRIEVFVLDAAGQVAAVHRRLQWHEDELLDDLKLQLLGGTHRGAATTPATHAAPVARGAPRWASTVLAVAMALFPKCPICGLSYLSLGGLAALPQLPGWYWTWPIFALALLTSLAVLAWMARQHRRWGGLALSAAGAAVLLGWGVPQSSDWGLWCGVALCAAGALTGVWGMGRRGEVALIHGA